MRHWECCVKRVEASESQTKEAAATFSAPPPPPPTVRPTEPLAKNKTENKTLSTGKRGPPFSRLWTRYRRQEHVFLGRAIILFFTGGDSAGRVSCLAERLRFFFHLSLLLGGARRFAGLFIFVGGGGGGGGAGDRSQNKGVFGWSGGMSEPRLALPFAFLKAGQMPL